MMAQEGRNDRAATPIAPGELPDDFPAQPVLLGPPPAHKRLNVNHVWFYLPYKKKSVSHHSIEANACGGRAVKRHRF